MSVKVGINGFGRIGRLAFRLMFDDDAFDVVAITSSRSPESLAHLLKYDTCQGKYKVDSIEAGEGKLIVDGKEVVILQGRTPDAFDWKGLGVELVMETNGKFKDYDSLMPHITVGGAKKVILSAPGKNMKTIVYNVNHETVEASDDVLSGASCTTNCLAPAAKILNDNFGLVKGLMTTIHAYTNDQKILDGSHSDLRRARAAAVNIVPTSTGAAKAVGKALPELNGKLDGYAVRVPVMTGSLVDLTCELAKEVTAEEINEAFKANTSETIGVTADPIVSTDIIGMNYGSLVDLGLTKVMTVDGKQLVKVVAWYDNEMSYTSQYVRLAKYVAEKFI